MKLPRPLAALLAAGATVLSLQTACATPDAPTTDEARQARIAEMYAEYRAEFPGVGEVEPSEAKGWLDRDDVVFVDVREPAEQAVSMVPGALTDEQFAARKDTLRDKTIVTYCTIGYRSGKLAAALQSEGFTVRNLAGSLLAWTHAGGPLEHEGEPVKALHVYGKRWDLARRDHRAVW